MEARDQKLLRELLTGQRVLSLSVLIDGSPYVGLLPFALRPDLSAALIHASSLARHSKGLEEGAPFGALIQMPDRLDADPLQLPRVSLEGTVHPLDRETPEYASGRELFIGRFPSSQRTFMLGDFRLHELRLDKGRFVGGFARAATVSRRILEELAASPGEVADA